ncbi:gametocyte-specific factor 1 homolog [Teleopsis dalmanni]|uniref:gametocyte-specific factor 1 homolog n=1 Tax=Teleopsis dalmanni TaxID=139649 RepID=UPI0018CC8CCE|nr:gametocyte-specific factor 1 homolog [Teleopsis dalmanni]
MFGNGVTISVEPEINYHLEKLIRESAIVEETNYHQCPYNAYHKISEGKLPVHLPKCQKLYKSDNKKICPYNITHIIDEHELEAHLLTCETRPIYDRYMRSQKLNQNNDVPKFEPLTSKTSWDDEPPVLTYNPQQYCLANPVCRSLKGASRLRRLAFRKFERKRIAAIKARISSEI